MKRVLLFAIMLACIFLLSACFGAFNFPVDNDELPRETEAQEIASESDAVQPSGTFGVQDGQEITIVFDFGERTGLYSGDMQDGLPHGTGVFSSSNSEGTGWVYEGEWSKGHMQGEGTTTFETGYKETGWYENDYLTGQGSIYQQDQLLFEGEFSMNVPNGQGTLYSYCGEVIFTGNFADGFIDETGEAREARIVPFKQGCETPDYTALLESAESGGDLRVQVSGIVYYAYETEASGYDSSFILDMGGKMVYVSLHLSTGETPIAAGKRVTVWGIADYVYTYETEAGTQASLPMIEAWDVMDISGTQL